MLRRKRGPLTKWVASTNAAITWASVSLSTSRVSHNPTSGLVLSSDAVAFGRAQESHLSAAALSINTALDKLLGLPVLPPCCPSSLTMWISASPVGPCCLPGGGITSSVLKGDCAHVCFLSAPRGCEHVTGPVSHCCH